MIRHCVFIRFKPTISVAYKTELFNEIDALKDRLPGMVAVHIGTNVSPDTGMDKGFSDGFIVDFADSFSRDAYLEDPEHRQTGARLNRSRKCGWLARSGATYSRSSSPARKRSIVVSRSLSALVRVAARMPLAVAERSWSCISAISGLTTTQVPASIVAGS